MCGLLAEGIADGIRRVTETLHSESVNLRYRVCGMWLDFHVPGKIKTWAELMGISTP